MEPNLFTGYVYRYTSPSGKVYIGQTIQDPVKRAGFKGRYYRTSTYFYNAIQKYGLESFELITLHTLVESTKERLVFLLNELEKTEIRLHKSDDRDYGYNITNGGCSYALPEGTRDGKLNSMYGKTHTKETRAVISERRKQWFIDHPEAHKGSANPTFGKQINVGEKNGMHGKKPANYKDIDEQVLELYKVISNMSEIARQLNVTPNCVRQKLKSLGATKYGTNLI